MATTPKAPFSEDIRNRLKEHFSGDGPHNNRWAALWDAGDFLPWDQGIPNPALVDTLVDRKDLLGAPILVEEDGNQRRKRALVPGCGRGYDVLLLASMGYDAYGLEVSEEAVRQAEKWAQEHLNDYPISNKTIGAGKARFVLGDFFKDEWFNAAGGLGKFELLYDYTFFCALPPSLRPSWAARYTQLLSTHPESVLVCVEFPTYKELSTGGPPWGVSSTVYQAHLSYPGAELQYDQEGNPIIPTEVSKTRGLTRIGHWKAERTHKMGQGTDWVSVWKISM
ncbi:putative thiol methyltransferase [Aspergillus coremiiformis]|uniref:Putative thiol methyltransferase n=1 Tax=Aspergillus coremiiformis TaxID=138285 RepID=A0A5N6Z7E5_9EURO|nr:putative thiol methyltransferase [Aspergillus coremiiformis]